MRVTIEDGVYNLVIMVKIESMFDNGKGHMTRTTDIFSSCGYAGKLVGDRRRANKSGSRGEGVRNGEGEDELWNEKIQESSFLRVDKLAISATSIVTVWDVI